MLALPAGFSYVTFSHTGSTMSDGNPTPLALDGMAAFPGRRPEEVQLIRNSEDRNLVGVPGSVVGDPAAKYDPAGGGGTTTLEYDERLRELVADWISLNGTTVNCAGGIGLGQAELAHVRGDGRGPEATAPAEQFLQRHGYMYEVPVDRGPGELELGEPIRAAGRFSHEATAVDQRRGIVYETEDPGSGLGAGFYRYIPDDPRQLTAGGRLQMLAVRGPPQLDPREGQGPGRPLLVVGYDIAEPDPPHTGDRRPAADVRAGLVKGATMFNRLEGCGRSAGAMFIVSTSGGDVKNGDVNTDGYAEGFGQIWMYRPRGDGRAADARLRVASRTELDSPDNMTVTPRGGLLMCEDDASAAYVDTHPLAHRVENVNRVDRAEHDAARSSSPSTCYSTSELAGVCFSPTARRCSSTCSGGRGSPRRRSRG